MCSPFSSFTIYVYPRIKVSWFHFFFLDGDDSLIRYCSIVNDVAISIIVFDSFCPPVEKGKNKHGNGLPFVVFSETAVWERWDFKRNP